MTMTGKQEAELFKLVREAGKTRELKRFYGSFEIKSIEQFKDAIKTLAEYAERLPSEGKLELADDECCRLRETFWTVANNFDSYVTYQSLADLCRGMEKERQQIKAIMNVKANLRATETPNAGSVFEYFSDVPEETAKIFVEKYYGPCTEAQEENCKLYLDSSSAHVATYIRGTTLAFGGSRTSKELKEAFVW